MTAERILSKSYDVEDRLTLDVVIRRGGEIVAENWALNDVSVEKASRQRMLDVLVDVDGRPLSRWSGDGIVCATPTGSTAYAFSAGGPVVWPSVQALLLVPISAHALFARPLVISPESCIAIHVRAGTGSGVVFCDGRRTLDVQPDDRVEIVRGARPVRLARLRSAPFTDRLVEKFRLPVHGWRGSAPAD
jgi:NAD+ kinase